MKLIALAMFVPLVATASALGQCSPPKYEIGKILGDGTDGIVMHISVGVTDFAPQRLVCLASALKRRYGDRKSILCEIFSDRSVAKQYVLLTSLDDPAVMFKRTTFMHATYSYGPDHGERLRINPDPLQAGPGSSTETIINLPVAGTPQCRVQLNGRCLLVLPTIWPFRGGSDESGESGSVTLGGKVAPNGRIRDIRVLESHLSRGEDEDFLRSAALQNLKAWRFETGAHPEAFRVTYQYRLTPPHPGERSYHAEVRLEQPDNSVTEISLSILKP